MAKPRLHAVTRVGVREADIFRLWLQYYRPHVDAFTILLVQEKGDDVSSLIELCKDHDAAWTIFACDHFESWPALAALKSACMAAPADWLLHTDTDEMLTQIDALPGILAEMEAEGADYFSAQMIDRLAPEGKLRGLDGIHTPADLAAAFPVQALITKLLARGGYQKLCISRWPHPCIHLPEGPLTKRAKRKGTLDHYKWRDDLRDRLVKRFIDYTLAGISWVGESERLLDELQSHGRIRVELWPAEPQSRSLMWTKLNQTIRPLSKC
jgi:hypothetical protein